MRIAMLTGTYRKNSAFKTAQAFNNRAKIQCDLIHYENTLLTLTGHAQKCTFYVDGTPTDITEYDAVYIHGAGAEELRPLIALIAKQHAISCFNKENTETQYINKAAQYLAFIRAGLPTPKTVVGYPSLLKRVFLTENLAPQIVKLASGSNGRDNFLINTAADMQACDDACVYVMQPFIPNDFDYRIIVGGGKVLLSYKRSRDKTRTHVNNVRQGATRIFSNNDLPESIASLAIRASHAVEREISGIDIIVSEDNQYYILESNFNFGLPNAEDIPASYFDQLEEFFLGYLHRNYSQGKE